MGHLKQLKRILTTIDAIWLYEVLLASPYWTSHIGYEIVALLLLSSAIRAVLICLHSITAEYNGPPEAAQAHIDDDRCDMVI